jgi:hypothetical protein
VQIVFRRSSHSPIEYAILLQVRIGRGDGEDHRLVLGRLAGANLRLTMPTPAEKAAYAAFVDASLSDENPGYPYGTAFIPWQQTPDTDFVLWSYLHEGRPAVIVGTGNVELLIEPVKVGWFEHLRNGLLRRVAVRVSYRYKDTPPAPEMPPVRAEIGRHALEQLVPATA